MRAAVARRGVTQAVATPSKKAAEGPKRSKVEIIKEVGPHPLQ